MKNHENDITNEAYAKTVSQEQMAWKKKIFKRPGLVERSSKKISGWVNGVMPEGVHRTLTTGVKGIVHTALFTAKYTPGGQVLREITLMERDHKAEEVISRFQKIASAEGAGTGAGGLLLGLADFPALLAIKMKMLFELAHVYGFNTANLRERMYLLHVFQLAFSGYEHRKQIYQKIIEWDEAESMNSFTEDSIDWRKLQQEYRDSIDFRKMLQLIPGIGAIVGAWVNYALVDDLGETAVQCYRMRILESPFE